MKKIKYKDYKSSYIIFILNFCEAYQWQIHYLQAHTITILTMYKHFINIKCIDVKQQTYVLTIKLHRTNSSLRIFEQ